MKYSVFAIEDTIARKYIHLFVEDNQATALRSFQNWCNKIDNAKDFRLWFVGTWDIYSGVLDAVEHELVVEGKVE